MKIKIMDNYKTADTKLEILSAIKNRWSPRAFSDQEVTQDDLTTLLEAARWAASSMNEQPWRFIYAFKGEEAYDKIASSLMPGNVTWASEAPVLIATVVKTTFDRNGRTNASAAHDLGLAVGNLSIQATTMGIGLHQMGGFDSSIIAEQFNLSEEYKPISVIAAGYFGEANQLEEPLRSRELAPRNRKNLSEIAFHGKF
ncbi:MAG: nitroreductase [Marinoscillum sp.]|jgi:nitroreductase